MAIDPIDKEPSPLCKINTAHSPDDKILGISLVYYLSNHACSWQGLNQGFYVLLKLPVIFFVSQAIPPRGKEPNPLRDKNAAVNKILAKLLPTIPKAELLDAVGDFILSDGTINPLEMYDYLHFTSRGYEKIFEPLQMRLEDLLSSKWWDKNNDIGFHYFIVQQGSHIYFFLFYHILCTCTWWKCVVICEFYEAVSCFRINRKTMSIQL